MTQTTENPSSDKRPTIEIRPYTKKELCELYKISPATLRTWLLDYDTLFKNKWKKLFNVNEVEFIFQTFGIPKKISV
ncbi:MAG: hypothetical protein HY841_04005 [Bacteroidetes bacterium]|nr:hypothetical protein [Bacteroidota bacterium]